MSNVVPRKFRRKPMFVDAVQVTKENFVEIAEWCQGTIKRNADDVPVDWLEEGVEINPDEMYIHVRVHQPKNPKQTQARCGDWLLYTERGYKVYTDRAFHHSFDAVREVTPAVEVAETTQPTVEDAARAAEELGMAEKAPIEMTEEERKAQIRTEAREQQ